MPLGQCLAEWSGKTSRAEILDLRLEGSEDGTLKGQVVEWKTVQTKEREQKSFKIRSGKWTRTSEIQEEG